MKKFKENIWIILFVVGVIGGIGGLLISKDKWISKSSKKRYAYPTKEEALINYIKRTEKRLRILESQIKLCKTGLSQANELS